MFSKDEEDAEDDDSKTTIKDIKPIHALLQQYGRKGELLPRPLSVLYDHVRDFTVYVDEKNRLSIYEIQRNWRIFPDTRFWHNMLTANAYPVQVGFNVS